MGVSENLDRVRDELRGAEAEHGRSQGSTRLIAVSKKVSVPRILEALRSGQFDFAENYVQEALEEVAAIEDGRVRWHFIGRLQSNKIKRIAQHFSWVHSLSDAEHALQLSQARMLSAIPLNVCVQVNVSGEQTKSGVSVDQVDSLIDVVNDLPHLRFRGLMCMAQKTEETGELRRVFDVTAALQRGVIERGIACDTLSMGMSADYVEAIAAGSTMVRIGSAIFGERE